MNEKRAQKAGEATIRKIHTMSDKQLMEMETGMMLLLTHIEEELGKRRLPCNVEL